MATSKLLLRRATPDDVSAIEAIERESFPDPWDRETFFEALAYYGSTCFVAADEAHLLGFIAAGIEDTGEEKYGHIMNIAVAPGHRREGIGRRLVQRMEQECMVEGASAVQLEVREGNASAQRFYLRLGYRQVLRIAGYYADGENAVIMMKWFRY
ncbi:MAG: ribosomal protein S18-alanine N-acetyltransferase [Methanomicrobiales archaeon]|nr:ribosomal protein S18-alanine N-acetyltransferase [Methanomicrobiales archaeon]